MLTAFPMSEPDYPGIKLDWVNVDLAAVVQPHVATLQLPEEGVYLVQVHGFVDTLTRGKFSALLSVTWDNQGGMLLTDTTLLSDAIAGTVTSITATAPNAAGAFTVTLATNEASTARAARFRARVLSLREPSELLIY